jgi:hypothetical protein
VATAHLIISASLNLFTHTFIALRAVSLIVTPRVAFHSFGALAAIALPFNNIKKGKLNRALTMGIIATEDPGIEPVSMTYGADTSGFVPGCITDFINRRAYQLFEERGRQPGKELDDWLEAEREARAHFGL